MTNLKTYKIKNFSIVEVSKGYFKLYKTYNFVFFTIKKPLLERFYNFTGKIVKRPVTGNKSSVKRYLRDVLGVRVPDVLLHEQ